MVCGVSLAEVTDNGITVTRDILQINDSQVGSLTILVLYLFFFHLQGVKKKAGNEFSSHYWHKYLTYMENKDIYGILMISTFHTILCFYSIAFQSLAIVRQGMSPPTVTYIILHLFQMPTIPLAAMHF